MTQERETKTETVVVGKLLDAKGQLISVVYTQNEWEVVNPARPIKDVEPGVYL